MYKITKLPRLSYLLAPLFIIIAFFTSAQQRVGLVLSGGGASGIAHVGVLKALEERGIPIDFIAGSSSGALVGSLYACGYSPEEIEAFVLSQEFKYMTSGVLDAKHHFLYRQEDANASTFNFSISRDSILRKSIPLSIITPILMDFEMLRSLGITSAAYKEDFDALFVPFRSVASDVLNKKSVVFRSGNLNEAIRASITYPLYINPIKIDGKIYFDGGLYNNFPLDVMYNEFSPDFIIGSNVTNNSSVVDEQDFIGLLNTMMTIPTKYEMPCKNGLVIRPNTKVETFDFNNIKQAIDDGYNSTLLYLDSIELFVKNKVPKELVNKRRVLFRSSIPPLRISEIKSRNENNSEFNFVKKSIIREKKNEVLSELSFEKRFFRLYEAPQIDYIFPTLKLKSDSSYALNLNLKKARNFKFDIGGHVSSRAVNMAYVGITYRSINSVASSIHAESYFGKFYSSAKADISIDIPAILPATFSPYFVLNRWDYFRSFATFFEEVQPSFLIQNEIYYGLKIKHSVTNSIKSTFDARFFRLEDSYYQSTNFTNIDTADITIFRGFSASWELKKSTLNRKQFANRGNLFLFKVRLVDGFEKSFAGSTSFYDSIFNINHQWINLNAEFQNYFSLKKLLHVGIHLRGQLNSQSLFSNYTATLLSLPTFSPLVDAETYFLSEYRSHQHFGGGLNLVFTLKKNIDFRIDAYFYQPIILLQENENGSSQFTKPLKGNTFMGSSSFVFQTPIGPLRATLNYFPKQDKPFQFQVSYGYVLFNERAIR